MLGARCGGHNSCQSWFAGMRTICATCAGWGAAIPTFLKQQAIAAPAYRIRLGAMMLRRLFFVLAVILFAPNFAPSALAGPIGSEFRVNITTDEDQWGSQIATLKSGGFVVVWRAFADYDDHWNPLYRVMGRIYDATGVPISQELALSYETPEATVQSVAGLPSGGFVVVGRDRDWPSGYNYFIWRRTFDQNGVAIAYDDHVSATGAYPLSPVVSGLSNGGNVIIWEATVSNSDLNIYGQRFNSVGSRVGARFRVNTTTARDQRFPAVVGLRQGGFVVVWESDRQDGSGFGVYAQRYNSSGAPLGNEFRVNSTTKGHQLSPSAAALANGDFVIAWTAGGQDGSGSAVYAQRYRPSGVRIGREFRVNSTTTGGQSLSAVTALYGGGYVVTWTSGPLPGAPQSTGQDGSGKGIYGQRYSAAGPRVGDEFKINTYTAGDQFASAVRRYAKGFVVTWTSHGQDAAYSDGIYAQRFGN